MISLFLCFKKSVDDNSHIFQSALKNMDKKSYCSNPLTEAHFYGDRYAVINNTAQEQTTDFYDMNGKKERLILKPYEISWIKEN